MPDMDTSWSEAREPWERVKWARLHAKYATARAAADSLGEKEGTYIAYERAPGSSKWSKLNSQRAIQFGRKFRVSWIWLLTGDGTPFENVMSDAQARLAAAIADQPEEEQERIVNIVELMVKKAS